MAKINLKRGLTDIVLYIIIFIVVQIIVMYAGAGIWAGIKGEGYQATLQAVSTGSNRHPDGAYLGVQQCHHPRHLPEDEVDTAYPQIICFPSLGARFSGWHCSPWEPSFPCRSSMSS